MSPSALSPPARAAAFVDDWNTGLPADKTIKMEIFDVTEGLLIFAMILQVFAWLGMVAVQVCCVCVGSWKLLRGQRSGGCKPSPPLILVSPPLCRATHPTSGRALRQCSSSASSRRGGDGGALCSGRDLLTPPLPPHPQGTALFFQFVVVVYFATSPAMKGAGVCAGHF